MRLIDITKENWEDVIFLSTNETITVKGSGEPYEAKGMPSLCEEFVASNALSIVQSVYEDGWIIKAIEHDGNLIGFTMFGWNEEEEFYELCRIMIDRTMQNKGYGTQAERLAVQYVFETLNIPVLYADTILPNVRSQHVLEKVGFRYLRTEGDFKYYCIERPAGAAKEKQS